jgi:hypothetical protein
VTVLSWQTLVPLPNPELARVDIAAVNQACAEGLPGADHFDWDRGWRTLDDMAKSSGRFTSGMMPHFRAGRCDYAESERKFRVQVMITHLQRDLGVRYHPGRIAEDAVFQPEDSFLYGILDGEGGTCGNLPVLYAAIGRRLDYPIMLANTRQHLYCRWDGGVPGIETFNIDASGHGVSFFPDEHFRTGKYEMPLKQYEACGYGRTQSPREELAGFLLQRGIAWAKLKNFAEAVTALAWAHELSPLPQHVQCTAEAMGEWKRQVQARLPSRLFPKLDLGLPAPHFRRMPREVERELMGLAVTQRLLDDQRLEARWWRPMRANPHERPAELPERISADCRWSSPGRWVTIFPHLSEA